MSTLHSPVPQLHLTQAPTPRPHPITPTRERPVGSNEFARAPTIEIQRVPSNNVPAAGSAIHRALTLTRSISLGSTPGADMADAAASVVADAVMDAVNVARGTISVPPPASGNRPASRTSFRSRDRSSARRNSQNLAVANSSPHASLESYTTASPTSPTFATAHPDSSAVSLYSFNMATTRGTNTAAIEGTITITARDPTQQTEEPAPAPNRVGLFGRLAYPFRRHAMTTVPEITVHEPISEVELNDINSDHREPTDV